MTFTPGSVRNISCPHCGHDRDDNLYQPCPLCHSRKYWLLGYNYSHEARIFFGALAVTAFFAMLAFAAGAIFLIYFYLRF